MPAKEMNMSKEPVDLEQWAEELDEAAEDEDCDAAKLESCRQAQARAERLRKAAAILRGGEEPVGGAPPPGATDAAADDTSPKDEPVDEADDDERAKPSRKRA